MGKDYVIAYAGTGSLGYGFPEETLNNALDCDLDFIGCDAGSTDPGPYYLGASESTKSRTQLKRDLELLLKAAVRKNIPLIVGSAGTSGNNRGVDYFKELVEEIATENGYSLSLALIYSEVDKSYVRRKLREGKIRPLGSAPDLTDDDIDRAVHIVGLMGIEPYITALKMGAQVIIAGRSSDTSIFAAIPTMKGIPKAVAWHSAKVIECGGAVAAPKSFDGLIARMAMDHFIIETPNRNKTVPAMNVAAHTMYENDHPYIVHEPGGFMDTSDAVYEQLDEKRVKVTNSRFVEADEYTIKLEGSALIGYRSAFIAGIRDDVLIKSIDAFSEEVKKQSAAKIKKLFHASDDDFTINLRWYGKNGVMGEREIQAGHAFEVGLLADVVASTQQLADEMIAVVRSQALHQYFEGRLCTAGNLAFPYSPQTMSLGPVYEFCINHVVQVDDPEELFNIYFLQVPQK